MQNLRWRYLGVVLLLTSCTTPEEPVIYIPEPAPVVEPEPVPVMLSDEERRRARLLADILYAAKLAFADNRLQLPANNNAYDRYQEVLELDPGNAVALAGIQEIAVRYVALADAAIAVGQYDNAEALMIRAMRINSELPELAAARERLDAARQKLCYDPTLQLGEIEIAFGPELDNGSRLARVDTENRRGLVPGRTAGDEQNHGRSDDARRHKNDSAVVSGHQERNCSYFFFGANASLTCFSMLL